MRSFIRNLIDTFKRTVVPLFEVTASAPRSGRKEAKLQVETLEDRVVPAAPAFTAVAVSATQVNLAWNRVADAGSIVVDEWINGAWKQIATLNGGSTSVSVTGLSPKTTYYFDVGAATAYDFQWAAYQSVTTWASAPATPSLSARAISATQVSLAWNSVAGANNYLIDQWVNGAWKQIGNFGSGATSCTVSNLSASSTYYFTVGASNASGTAWAAYKSVTTPANTFRIDHPTADGTYTNVSGSLFGPNGPSYLDVHQGGVGDCWLMAGFAEVAARAPAYITNMFSYAGTAVENGVTVGLYNVRFYDNQGTPRTVLVDTELPNGGGTYAHPVNGILWVALAEKAYAQANGAGYVTSGRAGSDSYAALAGGQATWALHAITGKSASSFSIDPNNIAAAWNAGKFIVLSSSTHPASQYIVGDSASTHSYAVVGYNAWNGNPFTVYNPWGTDASGWALGTYHNHAVYGLFTANAAFLSQNFRAQDVTSASVRDREPVSLSSDMADLAFGHKKRDDWYLM
ncbi:MAG: hypothetical protein HYR84_01145 [Planctomycetes bacterium]|nr:hypothetical protein [Planctomycetota bacterium]